MAKVTEIYAPDFVPVFSKEGTITYEMFREAMIEELDKIEPTPASIESDRRIWLRLYAAKAGLEA